MMKPPNPQIDRTAVFVGCARNCAQFLPSVLNNIRSIGQLFSKSVYIFVENDSRDDTKQELRAWCSKQPGASIVSLDGLSRRFPQRTVCLASARNEYLKIIKSSYQDFDFMFVMDCDDVSVQLIESSRIIEAVEFLERDPQRAAVFSNSRGYYYDLWALRQKELCPNDVWEELCDFVSTNSVSDEEAYQVVFPKKIFQFDSKAAPVEVTSAFGGLGIYKIASVLRNKSQYVGSKTKQIPNRIFPGGLTFGYRTCNWQICEHVSYNLGFVMNKERLFIMPNLINCTTLEVKNTKFPASFWRGCIF
jgi:glycosyltransferase involved in cell wall biosynthesis